MNTFYTNLFFNAVDIIVPEILKLNLEPHTNKDYCKDISDVLIRYGTTAVNCGKDYLEACYDLYIGETPVDIPIGSERGQRLMRVFIGNVLICASLSVGLMRPEPLIGLVEPYLKDFIREKLKSSNRV